MEKDESGNVIVSELGKPTRYITDHNADGKAVFNNALDEKVPSTVLPGVILYDSFISPTHPIQMDNGSDLKTAKDPPKSSSLVPEGNTVARFIDFLPGKPEIWHRTVSLDYAVLISGELELLLDSGESKLLNPGDLIIQRGTEHAWRNPNSTQTARCFFVQASSEPLVINGHKLDEHTDWPKGGDE
ncbi:hypothetical protein FSARC_5988 [Fusarium sarcochroum]|uniref:Uncharacterized protein n=1 Tax=Fusarium sarcochroum TaxID=1208366 RepID=A0A8H4X9U5_9HYPO|nr:hypothetical protein FSARC_5988 [Fusarium sarcochroum]